MRFVQSILFALGLSLIGAGCPLGQTVTEGPKIAEPIESALSERPILQERGFGEIPPVPSPRLRPGTRGSVRVLVAELPDIPPNVTILKIKSGRPNPSELRNIGASLDIPGGTISETPASLELVTKWLDDQGLRWQFIASERRLDFIDPAYDRNGQTVPAWPSQERIFSTAETWLISRGLNTRKLGPPYIEPDHLDQQPRPSVIILHFNATQDGQGIFSDNGQPVKGATILLDAVSLKTVGGSVLQHVDPDRSDYPGLTLDEARSKLAQGGQGGIPGGDVTIDEITFEWFWIEDARVPSNIYLYPAWVGRGTIVYPDARTAPYRIVVPLVSG